MQSLRTVRLRFDSHRVALVAAILVAASTAAAMPSLAQGSGDPSAGRQLAQTWCATCHVVDKTKTTGSATGAPTFIAVARMKTSTDLGLHAFLQTSHPPMPDFQMSRMQIDDVVAYILTLKDE